MYGNYISWLNKLIVSRSAVMEFNRDEECVLKMLHLKLNYALGEKKGRYTVMINRTVKDIFWNHIGRLISLLKSKI